MSNKYKVIKYNELTWPGYDLCNFRKEQAETLKEKYGLNKFTWKQIELLWTCYSYSIEALTSINSYWADDTPKEIEKVFSVELEKLDDDINIDD